MMQQVDKDGSEEVGVWRVLRVVPGTSSQARGRRWDKLVVPAHPEPRV